MRRLRLPGAPSGRRLSLAARFALASAAILLAGALILGTWVTREIETSVLRRAAADSALYVEALVEPVVVSIVAGTFGDAERQFLARLFAPETTSGRVVSVKIWSPDGSVLYATDPEIIGQRMSSPGLRAALAGSVVSWRSGLDAEENAYERRIARSLIETYIPLRQSSTDRIVAVAEFYQTPDLLEAELERARRETWLIIAVATTAMYALLAGMVRAGSNTIDSQRRALEHAVAQLSATTQRLREVSAARAETDEAVLRRIAREIHDGLAQDLAAALLTLERGSPDGLARTAIESALAEVRALARGLALPDLAPLALGEVVEQACASHERKTGHPVERDIGPLCDEAPMPVKIASYRVLQEALSNAFRHAPQARVTVRAACDGGTLRIECADDGPGLPLAPVPGLGLRGMRERVDLLGGHLELAARPQGGTLVRAVLPLDELASRRSTEVPR